MIADESVSPLADWGAFDALDARKWHKNQMIYQQGEPAYSFYYLKKGGVKIFLSSESGMEKTLVLLSPGNIFGEAAFLDGLPRMSSAKATMDSEIVTVGKDALLDCFRQRPELAMVMLGYLSRTVRMLSGQVDGMAFLQAGPRIAQVLLRLAAGTPSAALSCSHEDLAALAGVSRVTASRTLSGFAKKGWITQGYRSITIRDFTALSRYFSSSQA